MRIARTLKEQSDFASKRAEETGVTEADFAAARNSGRRRSNGKRRLLARVDAIAEEQGRTPPFPANY